MPTLNGVLKLPWGGRRRRDSTRLIESCGFMDEASNAKNKTTLKQSGLKISHIPRYASSLYIQHSLSM